MERLDRAAIEGILPHREPILLLDEVFFPPVPSTAVGVRRFAEGEIWSEGDGTDLAALSAIEAAAQLGALMVAHEESIPRLEGYLALVRHWRPGDFMPGVETLVVTARITRMRGPFVTVAAEATWDDRFAGEGEVTVHINRG